MGKTKTLVLGATMLACTALLAGVAPAAEKGSEQGVIAIIKPGEAGLPYIEKRKAAKRLNPRMQAPPEPDKGDSGIWNPGDMPAWARDAFGNKGGAGGGGGGR